ncbi:MAG TPA: thioredoxin [Porphyromonadaceae bacterium]|jgi:thioredoxin 1|nr:thioredoxin [Paramuribaculum sp.]HAB41459.1 thioredoxin [Porphyromonadaceae bacterium]
MSQFTDIINEKKPTLVDFYATWCGPCKMQGPIIEEVKAAVGDEANVLKIDVDRNPELAAQYRIQSVPTLIIFRSGEAVWRAPGLHQKADLVDEIRKHIATKSDEQ